MDKDITQNLIRALMFFGITQGWELDCLMDEYKRLGIPTNLVNETFAETLNEGME